MINQLILVVLTSLVVIYLAVYAFIDYSYKSFYYGKEIQIEYKNSDDELISLNARLTMPTKQFLVEGKAPVAVIVPDAGFIDLDCNSTVDKDSYNTNTYLQLANQLRDQGIATLRYNKRNILPYSFNGQNESFTGVQEFAEDVAQIFQYLQQTDKFSDYHIIGHGEGTTIGLYAYNYFLKKQNIVTKFISLNGYGYDTQEIIQYNLGFELPYNVQQEVKEFLDEVKFAALPECTQNMNQFYLCNPESGIFRPNNLFYLYTLINTSTFELMKMIDIETLVLQGESDIQVVLENGQKLAISNEKYVKSHSFQNVNHILKESSLIRDQNLATFIDPELPVQSVVVNSIANFIIESL